MMFWGDIILKYPKLIPELAKFPWQPTWVGSVERADTRPLLQATSSH